MKQFLIFTLIVLTIIILIVTATTSWGLKLLAIILTSAVVGIVLLAIWEIAGEIAEGKL